MHRLLFSRVETNIDVSSITRASMKIQICRIKIYDGQNAEITLNIAQLLFDFIFALVCLTELDLIFILLCSRLNVHFDVYSGESFQTEASIKALSMLKEKALLTESDKGGFIVDLAKFKLPSTVIQKKDGTTLYITRDLGGK
jgi:hypothetical protein